MSETQEKLLAQLKVLHENHIAGLPGKIETRGLTDPAGILEMLADFQPELILMDLYMPMCKRRIWMRNVQASLRLKNPLAYACELSASTVDRRSPVMWVRYPPFLRTFNVLAPHSFPDHDFSTIPHIDSSRPSGRRAGFDLA